MDAAEQPAQEQAPPPEAAADAPPPAEGAEVKADTPVMQEMQPGASEGKPEEFENIKIPIKAFGEARKCDYIVYGAEGDPVTVEAQTAIEAMRKSGVTDPVRIVRDIPGLSVLIDRSKLLE